MKLNKRVGFGATLAALVGTVCILLSGVRTYGETPAEEQSIGRVLESIEEASTFVRLLKNTDKAKHQLFGTDKTSTVFVPTNRAFEQLDAERLAAIQNPANKHWLERVLTYHVLHGSRTDRFILSKVGFVRNGEGQYMKVGGSDETLRVDGAKIVRYDLACANGVVHFIDSVIEPKEEDLFEFLEQDGRFSILSQLIKRSGQTKLFQDRHNFYTIFAPTDAAFGTLPSGTIDQLMAPEKLDLLSDVIKTHIVSGVWTQKKIPYAVKLGTPGFDLKNKYGQELVYRDSGGVASIDNVKITQPDLSARNGFIHVIEKPLLPKRGRLVDTLKAAGQYTVFIDLMRKAGLYDILGQFAEQHTVFAPVDETFDTPQMQALLRDLRRPASRERLRGILLRHQAAGRKLLTNAIAFQRIKSDVGARLDVVRDGERRTVQGVKIVEPDLLAFNGVVHGIAGIIPEEMELPDSDQNWFAIREYVLATIKGGSELYTDYQYGESSQYFASRNYEFQARFADNLKRLYDISAGSFLGSVASDRSRNRDYDLAVTAWRQRNNFVNLLRELEEKGPLLVDEYVLRGKKTDPLEGTKK